MRFRNSLCALVLLLSACSRPPAEERLRERIESMQDAVAARDAGGFIEGVAPDFIGSGGLDRAALHNLVRLQLVRNARIGATLGPVDITLQGERATVKFDVVLTGGAGGLLPERAQAYAIESGWREEGGEWVVFAAEWEPKL